MLIGALFIGVIAGFVSAGIVLASGGGLLAALGAYILAGSGATMAILTLKILADTFGQAPAPSRKPALR